MPTGVVPNGHKMLISEIGLEPVTDVLIELSRVDVKLKHIIKLHAIVLSVHFSLLHMCSY